MNNISYKRHRFPPEIIQHAVWLYFRFTLSFRDVEDLLSQRGLDISYESIRYWALKFGAQYARRINYRRPRPNCKWHLDEMFISINGKRMYLWRAVDDEGEVLEVLVQSRRNKKAALKLMRKLLKKQGFLPSTIVTDKLPSYGAALRELGLSKYHDFGGRKKDAKVQISWFSATFSLCSFSHLQSLQHPAPPDFKKYTPPVSLCCY